MYQAHSCVRTVPLRSDLSPCPCVNNKTNNQRNVKCGECYKEQRALDIQRTHTERIKIMYLDEGTGI